MRANTIGDIYVGYGPYRNNTKTSSKTTAKGITES